MNFNDFKVRFICKYDYTFWLHLLREFIITFVFSFINNYLAIGIAIGFNSGYETQDGLKGWGCKNNKLIVEGFNWLDFLAGIIGIVGALTIKYFMGI